MNNFDLSGAEHLSARELAEMRESILAEARILADVVTGKNATNDQVQRLAALNDKIGAIDRIYDARKDEEARRPIRPQFPGAPVERSGNGWNGRSYGGGDVSGKALGDIFTDSIGWRTQTGSRPKFSVDFGEGSIPRFLQQKATLTTSIASPDPNRVGGVVLQPVAPPSILDLIPITTVRGGAIQYLRETAGFANAATTVAEGGLKPESTLGLEAVNVTPRVVATHIAATRQVLEDVSAAREFIEERLRYSVRKTAEAQVIGGDGVAPNLLGILNTPGIQTQAKGADPTPDAVYKAITKVAVTGQAQVSAAIFHPNDWQDIRLLRTADGMYIWGNPADAGPERIFGVPVLTSTAISEGTGLVGDFARFARIFTVGGLTLETGFSADDFVRNLVRFLAEMRLDIVVSRPTAFATVTGI